MHRNHFYLSLICLFYYSFAFSQEETIDPFKLDSEQIKEKKIKKITEKDKKGTDYRTIYYDRQGNCTIMNDYLMNEHVSSEITYNASNNPLKNQTIGYDYFKMLKKYNYRNSSGQMDSIVYEQPIPVADLFGCKEVFHYDQLGKINMVTVQLVKMDRFGEKSYREFLKKKYVYNSSGQVEVITDLIEWEIEDEEEEEKKGEVPIFNSHYTYFPDGTIQTELRTTIFNDTIHYKKFDQNGLLTTHFKNFNYSNVRNVGDFTEISNMFNGKFETSLNDNWQVSQFKRKYRTYLNGVVSGKLRDKAKKPKEDDDKEGIYESENESNDSDVSESIYRKYYTYIKMPETVINLQDSITNRSMRYVFSKNGDLYAYQLNTKEKQMYSFHYEKTEDPNQLHYRINLKDERRKEVVYLAVTENRTPKQGEPEYSFEFFSEKFRCEKSYTFDDIKNSVVVREVCNNGIESFEENVFDKTGKRKIRKKENIQYGQDGENYEQEDEQEDELEGELPYKDTMRSTTYYYDKVGTCIFEQEIDGIISTSTYSPKDSLLLKMELFADFAKKECVETRQFEYDAAGRIKFYTIISLRTDYDNYETEKVKKVKEQYEYAANGKILNYTREKSQKIYTYDASWNLIKITKKYGGLDEDLEGDSMSIWYNSHMLCERIDWGHSFDKERSHPTISVYEYEFW